jgi:hypothetical protein
VQLLWAATNASTVEESQAGSQKQETTPGASPPEHCPRLHGSVAKQLHADASLVRSHDAGRLTQAGCPLAEQPGEPFASLQPGLGDEVPGGHEPSLPLGTQPSPA